MMVGYRILAKLTVFSLFMFAYTICAQSADNPDKEAIQAVIATSAKALQSQDWAALEKVCSADWMHFSHMGDRWDMAATKSFFESHITDHTIKFSDVEVHISGDASMAWATFNEQTEYKFDGKPVKQSAIFTAVFEKEDDAWKMKLLHRSTPPPPAEG